MATANRAFITKLEDDFGIYPKAKAVIYDVEGGPASISLKANMETGFYDVGHGSAPICYTVMFYNSQEDELAGKHSRPLTFDVDVVDENETVIETRKEQYHTVDQTEPSVIAALAGVADGIERTLRAVRADIEAKYA